MEYIFDSDCISKLLNVTQEIYLKYLEILDVKYKGDDYYHLIGELTKLSKVEDNLLQSLPSSTRLLDDVNNTIKRIYECDDIFMYNFILNRIDSNISNLFALADEKELASLTNISFSDSQKNINFIYDEIYYNFILRLNKVINGYTNLKSKREVRFIQLGYIFSFKNISDAFINNNLCLDSDLISRYEDNFNDIDSYNSFLYLKNTTAFNLCESLLMMNITLSSYYEKDKNNTFYFSNILLFKSLLQEINDADFIDLKKSFMFDFLKFKDDNFIINKLKRCFELEYDRRFSLEKNESVQSLDVNTSNNLIALLKLENILFDKIMNLKLDGFDDFSVISSLLNYENDIIDEMDVNENNVSIVSDVIYRDLGFFIDIYGNLFRKNAIICRLKNKIDFFRKSDIAEGILEKNYESIMSNHIVDSLSKYNGNLSVVKLYFYMYPTLTTDLVLLDGNYSLIDRFSDETTSISLGNDNINDYFYDKNEQLYKCFTNIIDDLTKYSDIYESDWSSLLDFKLCELSDIIDSVSDEHLYEIKEELNSLDDGLIKKKALSLLRNRVH